MLAYAPQAWTSDDTDAVERLQDPVGDLAGVPAELDGRARLGGPEPPDRPDHADRDAGRGGVLRGPRLRARPDRADRRGAGRGRRTRSRSTTSIASCSSAAGSSGCAARSRTTAAGPPGWSSRPIGHGRSSASTRRSTRPAPPADRIRLARPRPGGVYRVVGLADARRSDRAGERRRPRRRRADVGRSVARRRSPRGGRLRRLPRLAVRARAQPSPWSSPASGRGRTASRGSGTGRPSGRRR